jgi:radical SAM protein with 4Fe4S-binding SPASM domain
MRGKSVTVITNGTCAGDYDYRSLKEIGVGLVELPILSYRPEIHDQLTQKEGSWRRVIESSEILQDLGVPIVGVVVLTKVNYPDLRETLEFLRNKGIKRIMVNRFNVGGRGIREWQSLSQSREELRSAFSLAEVKAKELHLSVSANVCTPFCILNPKDYPHIAMVSCSPRIEARPVTLDAAGNIRLCNHSPTILGNIHSTSLRDILRNPYLEKFSETVPQPCRGCVDFSKCLGGCKAAGEQVWDRLEDGDPILHLPQLQAGSGYPIV